jgi:hypothetical protein
LKTAIEIVDLPIDSMVIFHSYVSLPEGIEIVGIMIRENEKKQRYVQTRIMGNPEEPRFEEGR